MTELFGVLWKKSSRSENSNQCVEVALDLPVIAWHKSARSGNRGNCVEVACLRLVVGVRDSKDASGPALAFAAPGWRSFLADAKAGRFDA
jgi:hypothetical protein